MIRLLHLLKQLLMSESAEQHLIWTLVGKLQHIKPLIPAGKFSIDHLIRANSHSLIRTDLVVLTPAMKRQMWFWFTMLRMCSRKCAIPDPDYGLPPWALDIYTDSAGGSPEGNRGAGVVCSFWWAFLPWSHKINRGGKSSNGRSLAHMMSALELIGPLIAISSGYQWCRNNPIHFWVDNAGSVFIWKKGYSSSCLLSSTLVKAISSVAAGLGCHVDITKITRCSTPLAQMADALSKCAFSRFWDLAKRAGFSYLPLEPAWIPLSLVSWVNDPVPDDNHGNKILCELAKRTLVLGVNC